MSVQSDFFESLYSELVNRGVDSATAEKNVADLKEQLQSRTESEEQLNSVLSQIPPASIAETIYTTIRSQEGDTDAGAKSEVMVIDTDSDTVETTVREGKDAVAPLASEEEASEGSDGDESDTDIFNIDEDETADVSAEEASEETEEQSEEAESTEALDTFDMTADDEEDYNGYSEDASLDFEDDEDLAKYAPGKKRRVHSAAETLPGERKTVRKAGDAIDIFGEETGPKNTWLFIIMAIILIPIVFVIGLGLFALFILLWLALAAVITVLLIGLVALVAAGSAVALAGVLFGVIELVSGHTPAGTFEIGLALVVGSVTMFAGIWLYNFAVRFIPFIIKKLGVLLIKIFSLFKKSFRKIRELTSRI